jgi:anthranilate phosphoribosyltransferase
MTNEVVTRAIDAVCDGDHLTADHAAAVLAEIMEGRSDEVQTGAFLIALRAKGETVPELVGLARTMRALAAPVETLREDLVDTAGTGGGPSTFNVSTTAALVAAAAGCAVAKHGNRSSTSRCGSATCSRLWGSRSSSAPSRSHAASKRSASASCSRPAITRRWPTSSRRARRSRCGRSSTSSAR